MRRATAILMSLSVCVWSAALPASDQPLGVILDVPAGWQAQRQRGTVESYDAVRFLSPPQAGRRYAAYLAIHRRPIDHQSLDDGMTALLATLPEGAQVQARGTLVLGGLRAVSATAAYTIPASQVEPPIPAVLVVTRWTLVDRAAQRYEFVCSAEATAPGVLASCERALATVQWATPLHRRAPAVR